MDVHRTDTGGECDRETQRLGREEFWIVSLNTGRGIDKAIQPALLYWALSVQKGAQAPAEQIRWLCCLVTLVDPLAALTTFSLWLLCRGISSTYLPTVPILQQAHLQRVSPLGDITFWSARSLKYWSSKILQEDTPVLSWSVIYIFFTFMYSVLQVSIYYITLGSPSTMV